MDSERSAFSEQYSAEARFSGILTANVLRGTSCEGGW